MTRVFRDKGFFLLKKKTIEPYPLALASCVTHGWPSSPFRSSLGRTGVMGLFCPNPLPTQDHKVFRLLTPSAPHKQQML